MTTIFSLPWVPNSAPKHILTSKSSPSPVADNAETWLVKCYPVNSSSCCLRDDTTCCGDDTSNFFIYEPGRVTASLNSNGVNILLVTSSTSSTATNPGGQASSTSQNNDNNNKTVEIALGAVLGVVVIAAIFGITALWWKLRSEKGRRQRAETDLDAIRGSTQVAENNGCTKQSHHNSMAAQTQHPGAEYPSTQSSYPPSELPTTTTNTQHS